jgi:FkbM family methyltransferase
MKCVVVVPVGPAHDALFKECEHSVRVAEQHSAGPFSVIDIIAVDDTQGRIGRSAARNQGIERARAAGAEWIFLIDADDLVAENAFAAVQPHIHDYDAIWGQICSLKFGETVATLRNPQAAKISNLIELMVHDPYQSIQSGHLVRTEIACAHTFNVALDFGEDFDYYMRVWRNARCTKLAEPLFINRIGRSARGPKSGDGLQWRPAVHRILSSYAQQYGLTGRVTRNGVTAEFATPQPYDFVQQHFLMGRYYRQPELEFLAANMQPGARVIEAGAYLGNSAVFLAQHLKPTHLRLFEPNPQAAEQLRANLIRNHLDTADIAVQEIALGAKRGRGELHSPDTRNPHASYLTPKPQGHVGIIPLDEFVDEPVDLLIIDTGGMELAVLAGARQTIAKYRPAILIEVLNAYLPQLKSWLENQSYRIVTVFEQGYPRPRESKGYFIQSTQTAS